MLQINTGNLYKVLKDFYEMEPEKYNNKTNGITQRRFLLHGNPLLADWVTDHIGNEWITDLSQMSKLKIYADDEKAHQSLQSRYTNSDCPVQTQDENSLHNTL